MDFHFWPVRPRNSAVTLGLLAVILTGCVDAPVNFEVDTDYPDLTGTIFPLAPGSYWSYETTTGGVIVDNPLYLSASVIPFPTEIDRVEERYYYLDDREIDRVRNYGPAPVWIAPDGTPFTAEFGYLANDTMVVSAREFGSKYNGKGMLVDNEERYMPLKPIVGVSYRGLGGATYVGTENIAMQVYSGEAHIFESEDDRFTFVEGIGLVGYDSRIPGTQVYIPVVRLTDYHIGP